MADLLITGTDTGVGKTVVAAAIVMALRAKGVRAIGFKPAETGLQEGKEPDSEILARASAEKTPLAAPLLQLHEPLAPAVAADRAGTSIGARDIESRVELLRRSGYSLVIEGAGGVMAPLVWTAATRHRESSSEATGEKDSRCLSAGYTMLDLAERFGLEAIVVGRAGLGTLNHIAMTVAMLRSRSIPVRGVVLNGRSAVMDLAEATNPSALARMLPDLAIVEVPRHTSVDVIAASVPFVGPLVADAKGLSDASGR